MVGTKVKVLWVPKLAMGEVQVERYMSNTSKKIWLLPGGRSRCFQHLIVWTFALGSCWFKLYLNNTWLIFSPRWLYKIMESKGSTKSDEWFYMLDKKTFSNTKRKINKFIHLMNYENWYKNPSNRKELVSLMNTWIGKSFGTIKKVNKGTFT